MLGELYTLTTKIFYLVVFYSTLNVWQNGEVEKKN